MSAQEPHPFEGPDDGIGYPLDPPLKPPTSTQDAAGAIQPRPAAPPPVARDFGSSPAPVSPSPQPGKQLQHRSAGLSRSQIMALTPLAATAAFFICGFVFDGWAWSWVFFLAVPAMGIITGGDDDDDDDDD